MRNIKNGLIMKIIHQHREEHDVAHHMAVGKQSLTPNLLLQW